MKMTKEQGQLVLQHLKLARLEAIQRFNRSRNLPLNEDDWYSIAVYALCRAAINYVPNQRGFWGYGKHTIRNHFADVLYEVGPYRRPAKSNPKKPVKNIELSFEEHDLPIDTSPLEILIGIQELSIIDNQILEIF